MPAHNDIFYELPPSSTLFYGFSNHGFPYISIGEKWFCCFIMALTSDPKNKRTMFHPLRSYEIHDRKKVVLGAKG